MWLNHFGNYQNHTSPICAWILSKNNWLNLSKINCFLMVKKLRKSISIMMYVLLNLFDLVFIVFIHRDNKWSSPTSRRFHLEDAYWNYLHHALTFHKIDSKFCNPLFTRKYFTEYQEIHHIFDNFMVCC